jgi:hypothetical protein
LIETKAAQTGLVTSIRLLGVAETVERAKTLTHEVGGTFGIFTLGDSNGLVVSDAPFWERKALFASVLTRAAKPAPAFHILGAAELATLWHPPGITLAAIRNIAWGHRLTGEAPVNLPVATGSEEEKKLINFFC